jgi:endonuclease/exonuclease/phosphatase family metal-dependent hydrolase
MSFNIRFGTANDGDDSWPNRKELVYSTIQKFDPHVLGLQEALAFQIDAIQEAVPGYELVGVGRDDGKKAGEFSCLLVKTDRCEVEDSGTFWYSDTPEKPGSKHWGNQITRVCSWALLEDKLTNAKFHAFNTHWDHQSQPSREKSAELLVERMKNRKPPKTPFLVMGDFNAGEKNLAIRTLLESPLELRDSFRILRPDASEVGTFTGFRGERNGEKIDAILVSPAWTVVKAEIERTSDGDRYPSDHFPMTATIELR